MACSQLLGSLGPLSLTSSPLPTLSLNYPDDKSVRPTSRRTVLSLVLLRILPGGSYLKGNHTSLAPPRGPRGQIAGNQPQVGVKERRQPSTALDERPPLQPNGEIDIQPYEIIRFPFFFLSRSPMASESTQPFHAPSFLATHLGALSL